MFIFFWSALGFATRAIQLRKAEIPLFASWMQSPYNHLFFAGRFTDAGLRARRIAGLSAIGLLVIIAVDCVRGSL
jgi:hypothetical protein